MVDAWLTTTALRGELAIGGMTRHFTLHVPREGEAVGPRPLVVVLHGNYPEEGLGGHVMRTTTTFGREADARGWVVAYPDGHRGSWADGRGVTAAEEAGADDVGFLRALIEYAASRYGTAADRTVVAGISNGAFMAHRLAAVAGDRVAVLAAVAGTLPVATAALEPGYAVSALLIHGDADPIAPIGGGYSRHRGPNGELRGRGLLSLEEKRRVLATGRPMRRVVGGDLGDRRHRAGDGRRRRGQDAGRCVDRARRSAVHDPNDCVPELQGEPGQGGGGDQRLR